MYNKGIIYKKMVHVRILSFLLALLFFFHGLFTLSDYGKNWDETRRNWRGQAYLHFFLTGKKDYSDLKNQRKSVFQYEGNIFVGDTYTFPYFVRNNPIGHPPITDILTSFTNFIFFQKLGILGDIEGYHIFILLVSAVLAGAITYFTAEKYGIFSGIISYLSLVLYPLFLGESHFNFKDPVQAAFSSIMILVLYKGVNSQKKSWVFTSSIFAGLALGTKLNVFFMLLIFLFWMLIRYWNDFKKFKWPFSFSITVALTFFPIIAFSMVFISWPYLWNKPIEHIINIYRYYSFWGTNQQFQPEKYYFFGGFNAYAPLTILYTTPLIILVLSTFGLIYSLLYGRKEKDKFTFLISLWFIVPIVRVMLPGAGIVNGVREIMEYIPAMAILSGIGAYYLVRLLNTVVKQWHFSYSVLFLQAIVILLFLPIAFKLISIHPNENLYYNSLIGGVRGARDNKEWLWGNSFGNAYRQGANWLNLHVEKSAKISLGAALEGNLMRSWLRNDIQYSNRFKKDFLNQNGEYAVEMTSDLLGWPKFCYLTYLKTFVNPIHEIKVDNVTIMKIWKNEKKYLKKEPTLQNASDVLANCYEDEYDEVIKEIPPPLGFPEKK